jgi:hypothetical protein
MEIYGIEQSKSRARDSFISSIRRSNRNDFRIFDEGGLLKEGRSVFSLIFSLEMAISLRKKSTSSNPSANTKE